MSKNFFTFGEASRSRGIDLKTKVHALRIKESMPSESSLLRASSTKNQKRDLINDLEGFQASLRSSNASAFNKLGISTSISKEGENSNSFGLEGLEKSLNYKMKNFHQDLKSSTTHSPFLRNNKSPSKLKTYQFSTLNNISRSPSKKVDNYKPIISSSVFKRQLKEDVTNVVDSIAPVSPLKRPKKIQQEPIKIDFGSLGKISNSNYKSSSSFAGPSSFNLNNDNFAKNNNNPFEKNSSIFDSIKKKDSHIKSLFNDNTKGLFNKESSSLTSQDRVPMKMSFLKSKDPFGGLDMSLVSELTDRLKGMQSKDIESLTNMQVKDLLNLANVIAGIAKSSKFYS